MSNEDTGAPPDDPGPPTFRFQEPGPLDPAWTKRLADRLTTERKRVQQYRYSPGDRLSITIDGDPLTLEPIGTPAAPAWRAQLPAGGRRLYVSVEDGQGPLQLPSASVPDLETMEPDEALMIPIGGPDGPALRFFLDDDEREDGGRSLHLEYVTEPVFEPLILADCCVRRYRRDALLPWFDLVSPVYPFVDLRLQLDCRDGSARLRSRSQALPRLRCRPDSEDLSPLEGTEPGWRDYDVDHWEVPSLAAALGLPEDYHRWADGARAPTARGVRTRLREATSSLAAQLSLAQSKLLGALMGEARAAAYDWATLLAQLELYAPEPAPRRRYRGAATARPAWPPVLVYVLPQQSPDAWTLGVSWQQPPASPPQILARFGEHQIAAQYENRDGRHLIHLEGAAAERELAAPLTLRWEWTADSLSLTIQIGGADDGG